MKELRAFRLGEPGGLAVAGDEGKSLVEEADVDVQLFLQRGVDGGDFALGFADKEDFGGAVFLEEGGEPLDARIVFEGVADGGVLAGFLGFEFTGDAVEERDVVARDGRGAGLALGEAGHGGAGVAEYDAAGAVLIEERLDEGIARAGFGGVERGEEFVEAGAVFGEDLFEGGVVLRRERFLVDYFFGDLSDEAEVFGFFEERIEIVVTRGVEEAEAGEVTGEAELSGRGGEEEKAGGAFGEFLDEGVLGAGGVGRPLEVVGFVDDDEIPAGGDGLGAALLDVGEEGDAREGELGGVEGIFIGIARLNVAETDLVEDREPEIEAAEQLDEPLVGERLGNEDEGALHFADGEEALEDETGLDGFAEADFVGEEDAGNLARGDLLEDVELVRDEFEASAEEAADFGGAEFGLGLECAVAEIEDFAFVDLSGEEAFLGEGDAGDVGDGVFADAFVARAEIEKEAGRSGVVFDGFDGEGEAVAGGDGFAGAELDAFQDGGAEGVKAVFAGGGELDADAFGGFVHGGDDAETELGFAFAHAALADDR